MPLPFTPDCAKTAIVQQLHGQELVNLINWRLVGGWGAGELTQLVEELFGQWALHMLPLQSYQLTLDRVEGRGLRAAGDVASDWQLTVPPAGDILTDADNNATAAVVKLSTGFIGRNFRGRAYIAGVPNDQVQNGLLLAAYRNTVAAGLSNVITGVNSAVGWEAVVISYFTGGEPRSAGLPTTVTNVTSVTPYPGSQRRRRPS